MHHSFHPLQSCLARIFNGDPGSRHNNSCGIGVVLKGAKVLTCAHVINKALGRNSYPEMSLQPEKKILLDFPLTKSNKITEGKICFWNQEKDLAVIELLEELPDEISPIALHLFGESFDNQNINEKDHRIQAFGFPSNRPEGTWADCQLRWPNAKGWIEVFDPRTTGNFIKPGFSGGPVWDSTINQCIGIIVAVDKNEDARVGYLIPSNLIIEVWKDLPITKAARKKNLSDMPLLFPYLIDREPQIKEFIDLYSRNDSNFPKPIMAIIHGGQYQAHEKFAERLSEEIIPKITKERGYERIYLHWHQRFQNAPSISDLLIEGIGEHLLRNPDATCQQIQDYIAKYHPVVIVELEVLTSDWYIFGKDVLREIIEFWDKWPALSLGQHLVVLIRVINIPPSNRISEQIKYIGWKQTIYNEIKSCKEKKTSRLIHTVLPELSDITERDVRNWLQTTARDFYDQTSITLDELCMLLLPDQKPRPLGLLALDIKKYIKSNSSE